jgi:hypothetical protein
VTKFQDPNNMFMDPSNPQSEMDLYRLISVIRAVRILVMVLHFLYLLAIQNGESKEDCILKKMSDAVSKPAQGKSAAVEEDPFGSVFDSDYVSCSTAVSKLAQGKPAAVEEDPYGSVFDSDYVYHQD